MLVKSFDSSLPFQYNAIDTTITNRQENYYVGCDFALASQGDFSAFTVVKRRKDGKIQLIRIYRFRGMPFKEQLEVLKTINILYRPAKMLIDKSTFGELFLQELVQQGLPVDGFSFTQENRNAMINLSISKFQDTNIIIPYDKNDSDGAFLVDTLIKELTSFAVGKTRTNYATYISRGKHDDVAISFMMAIRAAAEEQPFLSYFRVGTYKEEPSFTPEKGGILNLNTR